MYLLKPKSAAVQSLIKMIKNQYKQIQRHRSIEEWIDKEQIEKLKLEENKMAKLKEEALNYEAPKTKNIADLETVDVDLKLEDREGKDNEGQVFKYKVVVVDGEEFRVPGSVIRNLKQVLEAKPDIKKVKVTKSGEGMNTRYTVIPLE